MSRSFNSFECKLNVTVVGGFCKLMFHFQMVRIEMSMVLFRPLQKIRRRNFGNLFSNSFLNPIAVLWLFAELWFYKWIIFWFQILENIKHRPGKTYRMFDKHNPLDESHVRMVMKALGHFHGRWIKYKFMSQAGQVSWGPILLLHIF
jgi:hypothetical protein